MPVGESHPRKHTISKLSTWFQVLQKKDSESEISEDANDDFDGMTEEDNVLQMTANVGIRVEIITRDWDEQKTCLLRRSLILPTWPPE